MTKVWRHTYIQRAFSLIEAAIVLAVIGLVIAGIWITSVTVVENRKISNTISDIMVIIAGARSLYDIYGFPTSGSLDRSSVLIQAGVVPQDLVSGSSIVSRWGTSTVVSQSYRAAQSGTAATPDVWTYFINDLPPASCRKLVIQLSSSFRSTNNLVHIQITDVSNTSLYTYPVSPTGTYCVDADGDGVVSRTGFFFAARAP